MTSSLGALLADVRLSPEGAGEERIAAAEQEMDCKLPADLKHLLAEHDGGEGTLGARKRPIQLWPLERIRAECEAQEVTRAVPGLALFGSDGGSEGYGWLRSEEHTSELQSRSDLVCRLLLEKKKNLIKDNRHSSSNN